MARPMQRRRHGPRNGHAPQTATPLRRPRHPNGARRQARAPGPDRSRIIEVRARWSRARRRPGIGKGVVRYYRHDSVVTGWEIKSEQPGRLRLKNPVLYRKSELCQAIERELMSVLGIDNYKTSPIRLARSWSTTTRRQLSKDQVIEILDSALAHAEHPTALDKLDLHLPLCTASLPLAAAAQFAVPAALAGGGGAVRLHLDPDLQGGSRGPVRGEAARGRRARRDRRGRLPGDHDDLPRGGALLVPGLRPGPGQEDAGQLQEAAAERLRQAAPVRLALPRRRRGPDLAGPAPEGRHHRRQHRRGRAGRRASSSKGWP